MFCTNCGVKNNQESEFCKKCGYKLNKEELNYAGFWIRFGAYFIDLIGVMIFAFFIGLVFGFIGIGDLIPTSGLGDYIFTYALWVIYSTFFITYWSSTPGKKIYGLQVKEENEEKPKFSTALKRSLLQPFSTLLFGAGYWNMNKDEKKQAWHDKSAHTTVIMKKRANYIIPDILAILGLLLYFYLRNLGSTQ